MLRHSVRRYKAVFLMGPPGVGKTTFGRAFAVLTSRQFFDLDREIEKEQGRSISQIFAADGEEAFREIELHTLHKLGKKPNTVLALGGGAVQNSERVEWLKRHGLLVSLTAAPDELAQRLYAEREKRPLFADVESESAARVRLDRLLASRDEFYSRGHLQLSLSFSSLDAAVLELMAFERQWFDRHFLHEAEKLGLQEPSIPEVMAHVKPRFILNERPYLLSIGVDGGRGARRTAGKRKAPALGKSKKSGGARGQDQGEAGAQRKPQASPATGGTVPAGKEPSRKRRPRNRKPPRKKND